MRYFDANKYFGVKMTQLMQFIDSINRMKRLLVLTAMPHSHCQQLLMFTYVRYDAELENRSTYYTRIH